MIHSRRPLEPVFHIAFWALLFALTFSATTPILNTESALLTSFLRVITLMTLAYVHLFLIIPLFFRKSKFIWYSLAVVVLLILSMIVNGFIFEFWLPFDIEEFPKRMLQFQQDRKRWMIGGPIPQLILTFATIFFTLVYALGKEFLEKEQQTTYLESEKIKHELSFLRTQINPHFLFNALNNLHATVQLNPEKAGEYILKLGDMLRYVLEDCRKDKVKLGEEITYIRNYIFFQEQRDHELQNITFDITGEDISDFELEPMLLIALVENAFIHSYTEQDPTTIRRHHH